MLWLKQKALVIGAAVLGVLAFFFRLKMVTVQRDRAKEERDALEASLQVQRKKEEIVKESKKDLASKEDEILKEISKEGEDFEGLDNLNNPNDW